MTPTDLRSINFRDLGGHHSRDGRLVRTGLIYRSGALPANADGLMPTLSGLGLGLICDLRGDMDRAQVRCAWPRAPGGSVLALAVTERLQKSVSAHVQALRDHPSEEAALTMMRQTYRSMPKAFEGHFGLLVDRLLVPGSFPALIHCAAGKDRTGFACAMLLLSMNVPEEAVYEDYMASSLASRPASAVGGGNPLEASFGDHLEKSVTDVIGSVRAEFLTLALDTIIRDYGSVDSYLSTAGLTADKRQQLGDALLV